MKYTLLDLAQTVLSSIDGDEINSISDSVEAEQVTKIIRTVYLDIAERANLPEHYGLVNLDASGDTAKPVLMTVPSTVQDIIWIKYNVETDEDTNMQYQDIPRMDLQNFLEMSYALDEDEDNVDAMQITADGSTFNILYKTDAAPSYWTSFNDNSVIFDSIDSDVDSTLQSSKTVCFAKKIFSWTMSDSFVPPLDDAQFALLLNESKALAALELRQSQNAKAEQFARRHWTKLQKSKNNVLEDSDFNKLPNFGRK